MVFGVLGLPATVVGSRPLPVNVKTLESILVEHLHRRRDECLAMIRAGS